MQQQAGNPVIVGGAASAAALRRAWQRRGARPLAALAVVALAHAWLLGLLPGWAPKRHADAPAVSLRIVLAPARPAAAAAAPADPAPVAPQPAEAAARSLVVAMARRAGDPPAAPASSAAPASAAAAPDAALRRPTDADRRQAAQTDAEGEPLPVYATRLPAPALLHYTLRYGALDGDATLLWRPEGERYELALEGRVFGRPLIEQLSRGALADVGISPERFTDRRRGRGGQAANFQREGARVAFSGARVDMLLPPGAQDRLSVLVQVAAVASAWPAAPAAGDAIVMWVVDARGYAGTWKFVVEGEETIALPLGSVQAWRLQREPRHADDPGMTLWLDPTRHWWPVRVRQARRGGEFVYELQLSAIDLRP